MRIACIPDLLHPSRAASDGIFDLVREPIRQGCAIDIGHAPGSKKLHGLSPAFDHARFHALAAQGKRLTPDALWAVTYCRMPLDALDYLFSNLPDELLVLSYDMPTWLREACVERGTAFLDLRYSPLRFGRDLYFALDTSVSPLRQRIVAHAVPDEELRLEAALLGANLRAHRSRLQEGKRHIFDLDGTLIFVTQPEADTALLAEDGHFLHAGDFIQRLDALREQRRLLCMVDYSDAHSAQAGERTRARLSSLLGVQVRPCPQSAYQLLSAHDDLELVGISAPLLQEAAWFDKVAHTLARPFTPLATAQGNGGYLQVHFEELLAPAFWHAVLTPAAPAPRVARLRSIDRHHARETFDAWGEHEKALNWERSLPWRAFERSGGIVQRRRIAALEQAQVAVAPSAQPAPASGMRGRIQRMKDSKAGQTAYILGNAPSLQDLDIDALMARESFWCNRAFELEAQGFAFRPAYYLMRDAINFQTWAERVMGIQAGIKFFGKEAYALIEKHWPEELARQDIVALEVSQTPGGCMFDDPAHFSHDPSLMLYSGYTVVLDAIQLAFYMGFSRVLVGGVDLDYSQPYFHGGTHNRRQEDMDTLTDYMRRSFVVARRHFENDGRLLAKITPSPHLALELVDAPDVRRQCT
ncbi:hypothetical protein FHY25_000934 [Xanthomonas arboricola]|uniref:hypothetical protein n=1 Tax=Xanthomonas campestris TaxID=339 RepID=UPI0023E98523|nr:hypothetical protein [Xanthomonas campestris]MCW2006353.1 hypothetical protein [Xanthomonas campestris]